MDLFSGTGSLGLESLSRRADLAYFVEKNFKALKIISYNIKSLNISKKKYKIVKKDVIKFLKGFDSFRWDIIFLDPPYNISGFKMKDIFRLLEVKDIADSNTTIIYEYFFKRDVKPEIGGLKILKESFFGDKKVIYLSQEEKVG